MLTYCFIHNCSLFQFSFNISYFFFASHPIKLFFPIVRDKHWVLTCINLLWEQINYFDSIKRGDISQWFILSQNLVRCSREHHVFHYNFFIVSLSFKFFFFPNADVPCRSQISPRLQWMLKFQSKIYQSFRLALLHSIQYKAICMFYLQIFVSFFFFLCTSVSF